MNNANRLELSAVQEKLRIYEKHLKNLHKQIYNLSLAAKMDPSFKVESKLEDLIRWSEEQIRQRSDGGTR